MSKEEKKVSITRNGVINYLKSLRYYFIPLGCFSLFVVLSLSIVIPYVYNQLANFGKEITTIIQGAQSSFDYQETINYGLKELSSINWGNTNSLKILADKDYISNLVVSSLKAGLTNYSEIESQISNLFNQTVNNIVGALIFFVVSLFLGLIVGFLVTKMHVRNLTAKRSFWKAILIYFVDSLIEATFVATIIYLMSLWNASSLFSVVIFGILFAIISLFEAYLVQGNKQVKLSQVLKASKVFDLMGSSLLIHIIALSFSIVVTLLTNTVAGLYISVPFIEIAFIVSSLNAESYVKKLVEINS